MKTLIKPKFNMATAKRKGQYTVQVLLCKKDLNGLTIKCSSFTGKDKRVIGIITREGKIETKNNRFGDMFYRHYDSAVNGKITLLLDLIFGKNRDKFPIINEKGLTEFKNG